MHILSKKNYLAELTSKFQCLEESLWIAKTRFNKNYMESILADDFFEFGRSGKIYSRKETLYILLQKIDAVVPLQNFKLHYISDDVVQTTYISEVTYDNEKQFANRSSIWVKKTDRWNLYFHQGTPVEKISNLE
jgi:hypothetical protein